MGESRWQQARAERRGFDRRSLLLAAVGLVIGLGALWAAGWPFAALEETTLIGGAALVAGVIVPAVDLWWGWLQVPARRVEARITAVEEKVAVGTPKAKELPVQVRLADAVRHGREAGNPHQAPGVRSAWLSYVAASLGHDLPDHVAHVLSRPDFDSQLTALERVAELHRPARQTFVQLS
jgi:hypothetical protein